MTNLTVKMCMLGSTGVGKSCLAVRYVEGCFDSNLSNTIGASYLHKKVETKNGTIYDLQIWDTAGQERFDTLARIYYRGAAVIIVVFDVTDKVSFAHGARKWMGELRKNCDLIGILLVLVGNKVDMDAVLRKVSKSEAEEYAKTLGAYYWETSAKSCFNVQEMFEDICLNLDENDQIRMKLSPSAPIGKGRLTVKSRSGKRVEASESKSDCCS